MTRLECTKDLLCIKQLSRDKHMYSLILIAPIKALMISYLTFPYFGMGRAGKQTSIVQGNHELFTNRSGIHLNSSQTALLYRFSIPALRCYDIKFSKWVHLSSSLKSYAQRPGLFYVQTSLLWASKTVRPEKITNHIIVLLSNQISCQMCVNTTVLCGKKQNKKPHCQFAITYK